MGSEIGPVDYMIVAFPGNQFKGEIAPALADLVDAGTIRIIDIAFVGKDADGDTVAFELTELDPEVQKGLDNLGIEVEGLFNEDDLRDAGEALEPNSSAALLVWENVWAREVASRPCAMPAVSWSRSSGCRTTSSRQPASGPSRPLERRAEMIGRRGPGLVRMAASTAVVAGTAGAVRHRQDQKYAAQDQAAYDQQMAAQAAAAPAAPAEPDYAAELEQLAQLKNQGILTDEEFEAKKKQILGI